MNRLNTNKVLHYTLLCVVVVLLSSCVNTLELVAPRGTERTAMSHEVAVDNARSYFLSHFGQNTRSNNQTPTEEAPYVVGNLIPDWNSGVTIANEHKTHTDFAMQKDYRYYLLLGENEEGQEQGVELYSRFVSVEDYSLGATSQYVATYIPDEEYLKSYGAVAQDYGINCAEWYEFSGVVLYTLPSGHHVAAYRYEKGELVGRSFLYDSEQTEEENIADFVAVMEGLRIGVAEVTGGTRADVDFIYFGGLGDTIIETAYTKDYSDHFYKAPLPEDYEIVEIITNTHTVLGGGGGGGNTSSILEEPTGEEVAEELFENYDSLSPEEKEELKNAMQQIIEDCMGKMLANTLKDNNVQPQYATSYPEHFDVPTEMQDASGYIYDQDMLVYRGEGADALLHELFHAYQYLRVNSEENFEAAMANYEIEAQVARINFYKRTHDITSDNWKEQFYLEGDNQALLLLSIGINKNGILKNGVTDKYLNLYISVATYFESEFDYIFDESMVLCYDYLRELSKYC